MGIWQLFSVLILAMFLASSWHLDEVCSRGSVFWRLLGRFGGPKYPKGGPEGTKSGPKTKQKTRSRFGTDLGRLQGGTMGDFETPFWSQNGPRRRKKTSKKQVEFSRSFLKDFGGQNWSERVPVLTPRSHFFF